MCGNSAGRGSCTSRVSEVLLAVARVEKDIGTFVADAGRTACAGYIVRDLTTVTWSRVIVLCSRATTALWSRQRSGHKVSKTVDVSAFKVSEASVSLSI
jgi:hypothetical protein